VARDTDKLPSICVELSYCCVAKDSAGETVVEYFEVEGSSTTSVVLGFAMLTAGVLKRSNGQRQ